MSDVAPMKFHWPGWSLSIPHANGTVTDYQVWAPTEGGRFKAPPGSQVGTPRKQWAAAWDNDDGTEGTYVRGESLEQVLAIFPKGIAEMFRDEITHGKP
jgi:hypothetical protein